MALSMATLPFWGQGNQNEGQHDYFGHMTPLALAWASHDADGISYYIITFLKSRQLK